MKNFHLITPSPALDLTSDMGEKKELAVQDRSKQAKKPRKRYTIYNQRQAWTPEEHGRFLKGLGDWGRDWRRIADFVGSKTVVQTRSHAQKHFLRLKKTDKRNCLPTSPTRPPPPPTPISPATPAVLSEPMAKVELFSLPPSSPFSAPGHRCMGLPLAADLGPPEATAAITDNSLHGTSAIKQSHDVPSLAEVQHFGSLADADCKTPECSVPGLAVPTCPLDEWDSNESKPQDFQFNNLEDHDIFETFPGLFRSYSF